MTREKSDGPYVMEAENMYLVVFLSYGIMISVIDDWLIIYTYL